ncbi:hypothetical protein HGI53_11850 [Clostridium beijerinckii]|jgi:heme/copper-type cytochrome/quinol oxidase subunit 4|uniref:Uncharacterized protein n=3 Tax=Clostridium TaxID=1485 RepID=A0AAW3W8D2_CLOBE|nr:hypothetical protein X276_08125 [Clostridium beijerinckii NRRL B-598]MBC2457904.1 hypothetical protein [Clostridium beijerinckii]PSM56133.1 hypothetical protein C4L39_19295 [Clostridium diolis]MBC2475131.1 hypothetical protein [Clostridium beijerinckii]MBE6090156.1 hypothetical protein [Clostridium beijerinckii]
MDFEGIIMYYNTKFKIINITISIITILTAIFSILKPNLRMIIMPIVLMLLGIQQLIMGINYFKLNKKKEYTLLIGVSIFLFLCSIVSIKLINS